MDVRPNNAMKQSISKVSVPFYEPPQRKTSAEIINEARLAIRGKYLRNCVFQLYFDVNLGL